MKDLLDKLSSYNIFNYLFPGVLFAAIGDRLTSYSLLYDDIVIGVFVYYFYGLVISRIGSLLLEPLLKWLRFIRFAQYKDFISASRIDNKIELLSEANNLYRTLVSVFACALFLRLVEFLQATIPVLSEYFLTIAVFLLAVMFVFSYRKQTDYIRIRITKVNNPNGIEEQSDVEDDNA